MAFFGSLIREVVDFVLTLTVLNNKVNCNIGRFGLGRLCGTCVTGSSFVRTGCGSPHAAGVAFPRGGEGLVRVCLRSVRGDCLSGSLNNCVSAGLVPGLARLTCRNCAFSGGSAGFNNPLGTANAR